MHKFYVLYAKIIQTTALAICHSSDRANSVVNDVLVKIWKIADKIDNVDNPEGWIFTITANTAKDAMRERSFVPLEENVVSDKDHIQDVIDKESFYWMIKDLSETEQTVIIEKFISCCTFQEISDNLNKPLTTVTSIYYRALEKIKAVLEK